MQIAASFTGSVRRHAVRWGVVAVALAAVVAAGLYWFAPWNLVIDRRVDEAIPTGRSMSGVVAANDEASADDGTAGESPPSEAVMLARGEFSSLEHSTTGAAVILELEDGSRYLRLDDLETSNGPDLRVYLSSVPAQDDWYVYDDGDFVDLGALKGNIGSSNYAIPADVDLSRFESAVVWCRRFSVGFGVAPLDSPRA
jgi:hypothetical protein